MSDAVTHTLGLAPPGVVLSFAVPSFWSEGPTANEAVGLFSEGLRRCRFRYEDEEDGKAGLKVGWGEGAVACSLGGDEERA